MKIIFFGIPDLGAICLNSLMCANKNVVAVVPPKSSHPAFETMKHIADNYNLPIITFDNSPNEPEFIEKIKSFNADIAVVAAFDHLLSKELIQTMPLGVINCHPSLLPYYRGGNPYFHVIANGETKTGVTIHYMDEKFDTGDIITQYEMPISPNDTLGTLFTTLNNKTVEFLLKTIDLIQSGQPINRIKQDQTKTYPTAPAIKPNSKELSLNWTQGSAEIERFVRACNPFFGATTIYKDCLLKIWSCEYSNEKSFNHYPCGTIVNLSNDNFAVSTSNGLIYPTVIQADMYFTCGAKEFMKRSNLQKGEKLTPFNGL